MPIDLPTLSVILFSAVIDSINPCAIGVLILMVSMVLEGKKGSIKRLFLLGSLYIFAIYLTNLAAGLGLIYFFSSIPLFVTEYLSIIVGSIVVFAGILEIKDYFWYGEGFSLHIPHAWSEKITSYAKNITIPGVIFLGIFVAAVELPCTGAPYLAVITLLSLNFNWYAFLLLVLYNLVFTIPLFAILFLVALGTRVSRIQNWKQANRGMMRFIIGYVLVGLGWLLILIANGTLNFG